MLLPACSPPKRTRNRGVAAATATAVREARASRVSNSSTGHRPVGPDSMGLRPEEAAAAIVRSLKRHPADLYSPFWNRWLAWLNLVAPAFSDRILNALFRYPRKK